MLYNCQFKTYDARRSPVERQAKPRRTSLLRRRAARLTIRVDPFDAPEQPLNTKQTFLHRKTRNLCFWGLPTHHAYETPSKLAVDGSIPLGFIGVPRNQPTQGRNELVLIGAHINTAVSNSFLAVNVGLAGVYPRWVACVYAWRAGRQMIIAVIHIHKGRITADIGWYT